MRTGDLCIRQVVSATADMPVMELTRLMRNKHVGSVVVVDKGKIAGLVSKIDLIDYLAKKFKD